MATMFRMLCHISSQVETGNTNMTQIRQEMAGYNNRVTELTQDLDEQNQIIQATVTNFNRCVDKVDVLSSVTVRHNEDIDMLKRRLEMLDVTNNRNKLVITGIVEKAEEDVKLVILTFFKAKLLIDDTITVLSAKRLGPSTAGTVRPIEILLENNQHKGLIYKHTKNLKGVTNENGYSYNIIDVLPERLQEQENRNRQLIRENKVRAKNNTAHKINMSVKQRRLYVNNQVYQKKAPLPTDRELLQLSQEDRERVQMARLASTTVYRERNNRFLAYVLETCDIQEVRATNRHLRLKHLDATHITVAHHLPTENPETSDYDDNGEIGAGSRMLKAITERKVDNVAVYLVRYHSGQNLGKRRFEVFKEMTNKALDLLEDRENFYASTIPSNINRVKIPKTVKMRTRGRVFGARGASHSQRGGRGGIPPQLSDNPFSEIETDTDSEVVINKKMQMARSFTDPNMAIR